MHEFIRQNINIREKSEKEKNISKCQSCGRNEKSFFRNMMNTLECICGVKFYGR